MKINLDKKILTIRGEPVKNEEPRPGTIEKVMNEIKRFPTDDVNILKGQFLKWQETLKDVVVKDQTIRDYLLLLLGSRIELKDKRREAFWVSDLGGLFSSSENKIVEVSDEKMEFLRRIVEHNKIKRPKPMGGEEDVELFFPYELGQLLKALEGEETDEVEPKPKKKK